MRKEWIYGKLICGALFLLGTCLPASAQTGHLSGVRVVNDEIKKNGREVHVNFVLDIEEMHVKRQESVRLYPVVVANTRKDGTSERKYYRSAGVVGVWSFLLWCWTVVSAIKYTAVRRR